MKTKKQIAIPSGEDLVIYQISFLSGNVDMKDLLIELIACRGGKQYEH